MHQGGVHVPEPLERGVLRGDVGHGPRRALGLRRGDERLVVKRVEEVAQPISRREPAPQEAAQPRIGLQDRDVLQTLAARGAQPDQGSMVSALFLER